jgi:thioredoxin 1
MSDQVLHLSDAEFDDTISQSNVPVLVDFGAPWCGPCRMIGPIIEELAEDYAGKVMFAKVNTDENPATAGKFDIMSIPALFGRALGAGRRVHPLSNQRYGTRVGRRTRRDARQRAASRCRVFQQHLKPLPGGQAHRGWDRTRFGWPCVGHPAQRDERGREQSGTAVRRAERPHVGRL